MQEWKRIALEAALVLSVLSLLSWVANGFSEDGLELSRDYFKAQRKPVGITKPKAPPKETEGDLPPRPESPEDAIRSRLEAVGLRVGEHEEVVSYFQDPAYQSGAYLFVDARNEGEHREGHIPGSRLLNHFYLERTLDVVVEAATAAALVIVYCNGGDCTDSESVALDLTENGIPAEQIVVYLGGMKAWKAAGLPVEKGDRER